MVKPLVWGIIGGVIGVSFLIIVAFYYGTEYDDARLAQINASYDYDTDRLRVTILLTDSNGDYTKVKGNADIIIQKDGHTVYSDKYYFEKDDFVSWKSVIGEAKITGYIIDIRQFFPSGSHDVFVDLNTKLHWEDLHDSFYSLESQQDSISIPPTLTEPIQQQVPEPESEPIQQQVPAPGFEDVPEMIVESENNCDSSYPDVCIPPYPPDLDCGEIEFRNFTVLQPDPHRFDGDKDGIGCESN